MGSKPIEIPPVDAQPAPGPDPLEDADVNVPQVVGVFE